MKKGILLILSICLVVATLLISCTSATAPTSPSATTSAPASTSAAPTSASPKPSTSPAAAKPQSGGTLTIATNTNPQGFDHALYPAGFLPHVYFANDTLLVSDWAKGAAGTGDVDFGISSQKRIDYTVGALAESFEIPQPGTIIFHIRKGVHFALDPNSEASRLVNGREVTADDVVFSLNRHIQSPQSYLQVTQPGIQNTTTVTKLDDWTVQVKTTQAYQFDSIWLMLPEREIWPPEVIQKYGNVTDWHNMVGTGPFMMTDYAPGSSLTFARNPTYWGKDPVGAGKGSQLPYVDTLKELIIPDSSVALTALRTGKVDQLGGVITISHDDATSLMQTSPQLQYHKYLSGQLAISMRTDKPDLPFKDQRVRQALMLATDFQTIKNKLDGGDSEILSFPLANIKGYDKAYMPMDELPKSVQALYGYDIQKAKQLLADAGYPNGFKTSVVTWNNPDYIDYLSAIKDMWSKIGVDLSIQPLEFGAYMGLTASRNYDQMLYGFYVEPGPYAQLLPYEGPNTFNRSWVKDAKVDATYGEILKYNLIDQAKVDQLYHDLMPYVLDQAWYLPRPVQYVYNFWWPWLKNYNGENQLGYQPLWPKYVWIDQQLKSQMQGGK